MANFQFRPIHDTTSRILDENIYPLIEGQVFFATDVNKVFVDIDGHRAAQTQLSSITNLGTGISEVFQQGVKGFEGQILVGRSGTGYRLFYVDLNSVAHNLTFTAEKLGDLTERSAYQGGALSYAGNWDSGKQYFADRLRTSVVKFNNEYYYAVTESNPSGATFAGDAAKWNKFSIEFESVATGLLLAENALITKQLILGQAGTDQGTIRSDGATALGTGTGFFLSNQSGGVFRVGNPDPANQNQMLWNGSTLSVTGAITATSGSFTGTISAGNGFIGDWQITSRGLLKSPNVFISSLGFIDFAGTGYDASGFLVNNNLRIDGRATGSANLISTKSGKFSVTADGVLNATDGNFSGTITSQSGEIGPWTIDSTGLVADGNDMRITPSAIQIKAGTVSNPIVTALSPGGLSYVVGGFGGFIPFTLTVDSGTNGVTFGSRNDVKFISTSGIHLINKPVAPGVESYVQIPGAEFVNGVLTIYLA